MSKRALFQGPPGQEPGDPRPQDRSDRRRRPPTLRHLRLRRRGQRVRHSGRAADRVVSPGLVGFLLVVLFWNGILKRFFKKIRTAFKAFLKKHFVSLKKIGENASIAHDSVEELESEGIFSHFLQKYLMFL